MDSPGMTLAARWRDHCLTGTAWVQSLLRREDVPTSLKPETMPDAIPRVLNAIAAGTFSSRDFFQTEGQRVKPGIFIKPPELEPNSSYLLIRLNAETARGRFVSSPVGGVVFEDPIWALLAAHALSVADKPQVAVPRAKDNGDLWAQIGQLEASIESGRYDPRLFFGPIEGWIQPDRSPRFELITVSSEQLAGLRSRGIQTLKISTPPRFFELFTAPAKAK
jgi:hypothetical protein